MWEQLNDRDGSVFKKGYNDKPVTKMVKDDSIFLHRFNRQGDYKSKLHQIKQEIDETTMKELDA